MVLVTATSRAALLARWSQGARLVGLRRRRCRAPHSQVGLLQLPRIQRPDVGHIVDVEAMVLQLLRDVRTALVKLTVV